MTTSKQSNSNDNDMDYKPISFNGDPLQCTDCTHLTANISGRNYVIAAYFKNKLMFLKCVSCGAKFIQSDELVAEFEAEVQ